jgi:K+ transporter
MAAWRDQVFTRMASNTADAAAAYHMPGPQAMQVVPRVGI